MNPTQPRNRLHLEVFCAALTGAALAAGFWLLMAARAPQTQAEFPRLEDAGPVVTFKHPQTEGER